MILRLFLFFPDLSLVILIKSILIKKKACNLSKNSDMGRVGIVYPRTHKNQFIYMDFRPLVVNKRKIKTIYIFF